MGLALIAAAFAAGILFLLVDRRTDAPVMRRRVNAGTERWQALERARDHSRRAGGGGVGNSAAPDGGWGDGGSGDSD